jgi:hypothetical protein
VGYGANRSADGSGGIFTITDVPQMGALFINAPYCDGAKVLVPEGVVRFTMKTKRYGQL